MAERDLAAVMVRPHTVTLMAAAALAAPGAALAQLAPLVNAEQAAAAGTVMMVAAGVLAVLAAVALAGDWMGAFSRWWPLPPLWGYRRALSARCYAYYGVAAAGYAGIVAYLVGVGGAAEALPIVVLWGTVVTLLAGHGASANLLLVVHDRQQHQQASVLGRQQTIGDDLRGRPPVMVGP
ncbi:hypothetical protein MUG78_17495 [Gordonia alkaliphila]|uniref:hypothetical protein n=1 Tax=Gordonia alkaliphila TaxID=1053547 RepID=UPI001FF3EEDB|nr:hypothetical protein [Gordonia alkaliphila]MCK0441196.1 hypothetical protein [Gordonia alkaliphila]